MGIVARFADEGRSGLNIAGREGLRELIRIVEAGTATFNAILVYDVSRWGRFQDADESAYYEYLCKRANIFVHYCAEPFANDGSLSSTLIKTLKRTMAGEFSRELSVKVFAGQCRLIELGFRQGGPAGFGLRRQLRDQAGNPKGILARGEMKSLQTDRVVLVPGPEEEVSIVGEIYRRFTKERQSEGEIAEVLNARGILTDLSRPWTRATVHQVLTNAKYAGANIYNRRSFKLKRKRGRNPPEMWIHREDAFVPIVARAIFDQAQLIIAARDFRFSDDEMLELLRRLLASQGSLSGILIDEAEGMPSRAAYRNRFGSLLRAYRLIEYAPSRDYAYLEINRALRERHRVEVDEIIRKLQAAGAAVSRDQDTDLLTVNDEFTASLVLARCRETQGGGFRWLLRLDTSLAPDITIGARLAPGNETVLDYYLIPSIECLAVRICLAPENGFTLDVYRFADLSFFLGLARQSEIEDAA